MDVAITHMTIRKLALALLLVLPATGALAAEEYQIGTGDVLSVSFWQDPTLNAEVRVSQDGTITLDIIGDIEAEGKTTQELQADIVRQMSRLNTRISQAVVRVSEYNHLYVFVSGQVREPGKKTFEEIPDLWTIINEAGGISEIGDLSRVTIIRGGDDAGKVITVDVRKAIAEGNMDDLPKIGRGDTVDIPRTAVGLPSADIGQSRELKNLIYVVGAVTHPGPIEYQQNVDVLEAISLAGGPSSGADLKKTKIVMKDAYYGQSLQLNLEQYTEEGRPARYIVNKEDVIVVPQKSGFFDRFSIGTVATALGIISTSVLIYTQLSDDDPAR